MQQTADFLIATGAILLILVGIGYVLTNPAKIKWLREFVHNLFKTTEQSKAEIKGLQSDLRGGLRVSSNAPKGEQYEDLRAGEMAEIKLAVAAALVEMTATGVGIFHGLNRQPRTQNYSPRGEEWIVKFFDNNLLVIHRPEGYYAFRMENRVTLAPEGAEVFNRAGEVFSNSPYGQVAGSYSFDWPAQEVHITALDVGYVEVELGGGNIPATDGMKIKYLLGQVKRQGYLFVQNNFVGPDYVWTRGVFLGESIEPYLGTLTRALA